MFIVDINVNYFFIDLVQLWNWLTSWKSRIAFLDGMEYSQSRPTLFWRWFVLTIWIETNFKYRKQIWHLNFPTRCQTPLRHKMFISKVLPCVFFLVKFFFPRLLCIGFLFVFPILLFSWLYYILYISIRTWLHFFY